MSNSTSTATNTTPTEIQGHILYSQDISKVRVLFRDKVGVQRDCIEEIKFYTYEPIGNVPIMTANNAPYGEVSASSTWNSTAQYAAFNVFDGTASKRWLASSSDASPWIQYKFVNPIIVKKVYVSNSTKYGTGTLEVIASNDGINWTSSLGTGVIPASTGGSIYISLDNNIPYLYYRVHYTKVNVITESGYTYTGQLYNIQFYGRELVIKENLIPKMTSETTPSGKVTKSSEQQANVAAYTCVGNSMYGGGAWYTPINTTTGWVAYEFDSAIEISGFVMGHTTYNYPTNYQLLGSNDGTNWDTLGTYTNSSGTREEKLNVLPENVTYKHYKLNVTASAQGSGASARYLCVEEFNVFIYKPDYSEKEFALHSTRKTIYDHGLELVTLSPICDASVLEANNILVKVASSTSGSQYGGVYTENQIDFSNFTMMCVKVGQKMYGVTSGSTFQLQVKTANTSYDSGRIGYAGCSDEDANLPYNFAYVFGDTIQQMAYACICMGNTNRYVDIKEWWLE